jgi:hypothetical protein
VLKVVKFSDWLNWGYNGTNGMPMAQVNLTGTITNTWHTLKLTFQGTQIQVYYDSQSVTNVTDTEPNAGAYSQGGISLDMYQAGISVTNVLVTP